MKHKKLTSLLAALTIAASAGTIATAHPVQASKLSTIKSTTGYRKVRLLKNVNVRKIHWRTPLYKSTLGSKQYVAKGEVVSIKWSGTNFGWYMKVPGHSGEYTISKKLNDTSWFTFNTKKPKKKHYSKIPNTPNGFEGNSYAKGNVKVTFDKVYNVKAYDPKAKKSTTEVVFTGTLTNHSEWEVDLDSWLDRFDFYNADNQWIIPLGFDFTENGDYRLSKILDNSYNRKVENESVKFALVTDILNDKEAKAAPTSKYVIKVIDGKRPISDDDYSYLPNELTLTASNDKYTGEIMW